LTNILDVIVRSSFAATKQSIFNHFLGLPRRH
jgi:hypothetical protein